MPGLAAAASPTERVFISASRWLENGSPCLLLFTSLNSTKRTGDANSRVYVFTYHHIGVGRERGGGGY